MVLSTFTVYISKFSNVVMHGMGFVFIQINMILVATLFMILLDKNILNIWINKYKDILVKAYFRTSAHRTFLLQIYVLFGTLYLKEILGLLCSSQYKPKAK